MAEPVPAYQPWQFFLNRQAVPPIEQRMARAAEFQALYLSRIDRHLERIANALEGELRLKPWPGTQPPRSPSPKRASERR